MKKQVGLSEDWLYGIVKESINGVISESGRSSYTQKKYNAATRNEIISNAQSEVDKLRAEISNLTKKIRVAQSPEAIEQLKRQRNILYNLRNRAVAKVWNLSNERVMTAAAKERATNRYREKIAKEKNKIRFTPEDVPTFMESKNVNKKMVRLTESGLHKIVKESVNKVIKESTNRDERDIKVFANLITNVPYEHAVWVARELQWESMGGNFDFSSFVEYLYRHMEGDGYQREVDYDAETM